MKAKELADALIELRDNYQDCDFPASDYETLTRASQALLEEQAMREWTEKHAREARRTHAAKVEAMEACVKLVQGNDHMVCHYDGQHAPYSKCVYCSDDECDEYCPRTIALTALAKVTDEN